MAWRSVVSIYPFMKKESLFYITLTSDIFKKGSQHARRIKYRSRGYEMPTVASQMKQAGMRNYYGNPNYTNIPFVVSKSTAPSHNIGVNIQQVTKTACFTTFGQIHLSFFIK